MEDFGLQGPGSQHTGQSGLNFAGAAEGFNQAQGDQQKLLLGLGRIAMQPAQFRKVNAEAAKLESAVEQDRLMSQLASKVMGESQGGTPGERRSTASPFEKLSEISMRSGLWGQSMKLSNLSSQMRQREATEVASLSRAEVNSLTAQRKELETLEGFLSAATDQASWETGNTLFAAMTGKPSPYANTPYSAEAQADLTKMSMLAKDRLQNLAITSEYGSRDKNRQSQIDHRAFLERMAERRLQLDRDREARRNKDGADKAPSTAEVNATTALVMNQIYPGVALDKLDPLEKTSITNGARALVSRAKALMKDNRALTWDQAQQQALTESRTAGDWQKKENLLTRDNTYFKGAGKTAETAAPMPAKKTELVKDRFYTNARGQIGQWTGTGFSAVAAPAGDGNTGDDDEDEDGEE